MIGGDDRILGGDGDDMLYGDIGADDAGLLDQGGDDVLDGGLGTISSTELAQDTASFASVAIAVIVDLAAGTATGQGKISLAGIENLRSGPPGATVSLATLAGTSSMAARALHTLNGSDGMTNFPMARVRDILNGGNGVDAFVLAADGTVDVFNGGNDADALNLINATWKNVTITFSGALGNGTVTGGGFGADTFTSIEFVAGSDGGGLVDTL